MGPAGLRKLRCASTPCPPGASRRSNPLVNSFGPWPAWALAAKELPLGAQGLLVIDQAEQIFRFADLPSSSEPARPCSLCGVFSAGAAGDSSGNALSWLLLFCCRFRSLRRWDAGQTLLRQAAAPARPDGEAGPAPWNRA